MGNLRYTEIVKIPPTTAGDIRLSDLGRNTAQIANESVKDVAQTTLQRLGRNVSQEVSVSAAEASQPVLAYGLVEEVQQITGDFPRPFAMGLVDSMPQLYEQGVTI